MVSAAVIEIPGHVPPDRIVDIPFWDRRLTDVNPFDSLVSEASHGPNIGYARNFFPISERGAWVPRRGRHLREIYADIEHFSKNNASAYARIIGEDWLMIPTELDHPVHADFRASLNPTFSPAKMASLDGWVRERARELIAKFKDDGECEFISQFATLFPVSIFLTLFGLPQDEVDQFLEWERVFMRGTDMEHRKNTVRAVKARLMEEIHDRIRNPKDDMISNALGLKVGGRNWTVDEVFGHCFNLFLGGLDTVTANLGWHFLHLANNPEDQARLRENPRDAIVAIEELLRSYAAVTTARKCVKRYEIDGIVIEPGDFVAMSTTIVGRDAEQFADPDVVDFDRKATHLTFGFGMHRCIGQHLARRELQLGMQEVLAAIPQFRLKENSELRFQTGTIVHVDTLHLAWN
ncbi:cytochrome P450 [Sphingomonas sp. SRS2]|uniref:cytochrome P450 n=1 Tax=Sphingomonas sp. SRS2 TaxID=133190 RepID=UPI000618489D|nr:cytochrome P450 [Sphingomonas sp. SRS2]KKC24564.1 hypothetical protein WP12_18525 [Sphingomonas sp. SRS2]